MNIDLFTRKLNRLRQVACHIDNHLAVPLTLEDLADIAHLSRFHFERTFTDYAGETPLARVRRLRLAEARQRIETGQVTSMMELSLEAGYSCPGAFSRAFRQAFSLSPSEITLKPDPVPAPIHIEYLPPLAIQYIPFRGQIDDSLLPFDELRARALLQNIPRERRKGWSIHLSGGTGNWSDTVEIQAALLSDRLGTRIRGLSHGTLPPGHYAVFTLAGGYHTPSRAELAWRIQTETDWYIQDGPILRNFQNSTYLPAQQEKSCHLYIPVSRTR